MDTALRSSPSQSLVFEPDEDELREQAATAGRGPRRLVAGIRLAAEARLARRRGPVEHEAEAEAPGPDPPVAKRSRAVPATTTRAPAPDPQTRPRTRRRSTTFLTTTNLCDARTAAAEARRLDAARSERRLMGQEDAAWEIWSQSEPEWDGGSSLATLDEAHRLAAHIRARKGWRRRASLALDRWAEREVAFGTRLDRALPGGRPDRP
jgi:hypothetical protein